MQLQENPCVCCAVVLLVSPPKTPKAVKRQPCPPRKVHPLWPTAWRNTSSLQSGRQRMLERRMVSWISWTLALYVSWNPFNDLEVFENYPPYPCNTLTQHAKLQHLGIKIQLNLTSANARLQKGLGTKVLAVPDRWSLTAAQLSKKHARKKESIFRCSPMPKKRSPAPHRDS